jgi:hypothetical protein
MKMYKFIESILQNNSMKHEDWNSFINYCVSMGFPFEATSQEPYFPDDSNAKEGKILFKRVGI